MATSNNEQRTKDKWVPSESCQKYMKEALITTFGSDVNVAYSKFGISFYINIYEIVARTMREKFASERSIKSVEVHKVIKEQSNDYYYAICVETTLSRNTRSMKDMSAWIANATIEEFPSVRNSIKVCPSFKSMNTHSIYFDKPSDILSQSNVEKMIETNFAENNLYSLLDVNIIGSSIRVFLKPENCTPIEGILSNLKTVDKWVPSQTCQKYMKKAFISAFENDVSVANSKSDISFDINIY